MLSVAFKLKRGWLHRGAGIAIIGLRKRVTLWTSVCTFAGGVLAVLWLLVRSGTKPSRFAYPCQQAAFGAAAAAFGVTPVVVLLACRTRLTTYLRTTPGRIIAGALIALSAALLATAAFEPQCEVVIMPPPAGYTPSVFLVNNARGIGPGRYGGVDDLITLMGVHGLKWHRTAVSGLTSGPDGLIASDDVVIIKTNAQWDQRGGTNTDVLRGVIRRIVEHPDVFAGEVIVADNGQGSGRFNRTENNAQNQDQSAQDVVDDFESEGWRVSTFMWDDIGRTSVAEYITGDSTDGYVVNPMLDEETCIRVSYPKFQSAYGTYISYKNGIWSPDSQTYDPTRLTVINLPVLKTHFIYAVTAAVKNHMGVVTRDLSTDSHNGVRRGGLGSFLAEVRMPDLTILDCIWVLARPGDGPDASYVEATRRDQLVAGADPVALDAWATKFILIPQIIENGYTLAEYHTWQDPDNPDSVFRLYLDRSMSEMLSAGIETTNDYNAVKLHVWVGDQDRDGDLDLNDFGIFQPCMSGPVGLIDPECEVFDFNEDRVLDLTDLAHFQSLFTGSSPGAFALQ